MDPTEPRTPIPARGQAFIHRVDGRLDAILMAAAAVFRAT
jgi:hypothetical protein